MENKVENRFIDKILKNKFLVGFVIVMGVLIVISAILRAITPPPPPAATVVTSDLQFTADVIFSPDISIEIPDKVSVYRAGPAPDIEKYAEKIAERLSLAPFQNFKNFWQDDQEIYSLATERNTTVISYKKDLLIQNTEIEDSRIVDKNMLSDSLRRFIDSHQIFTNYVLTEPKPFMIAPESYEPVTSDSDADVYQINVQYLIDGIPLYLSNQEQPPGIAWLDKNGDITRMNFYPLPNSFEKTETYNTLPLRSVETNIQNGEVTYILAENHEVIDPSQKQLKTITFSSASLEYRQQETNGYILPYIKFIGTGTNDLGIEYEVEAISPLVKVE